MDKKKELARLRFASSLPHGLGLWNVYFIVKFILATFGYLNLNVLGNALLIIALLLPQRRELKFAGVVNVILVALGVVLAYSESWLPGLESVLANARAIQGFSLAYVIDLARDFVNLSMVGWGICLIALYLLVRDWIRVTVLTIGYFLFFVLQPFFQTVETLETVPEVTDTQAVKRTVKKSEQSQEHQEIEQWYQAFLEYEAERQVTLPTGINAKDTPFDIVIMNICSLSKDDLEAVGLDTHKFFTRFDVIFDQFNTATSYSGPATLRLLNGVCGQPSHTKLYDGRRPECEIMNRLESLGFKQHLYFDHAGDYDNYLDTLRNKAGLSPKLSSRTTPVRYVGFDDEPIADDLAVMRSWLRDIRKAKDPRTVTLFNFISLHDGNRLPRQSRAEPFKPRAKRLLDQMNLFVSELERSGRKVLLIVVPEHGAAVRGDRVQASRLRDIPTPAITQVPTMVKFVGLKNLAPVHITHDASYQAITSLIGKTIETNYFSLREGSMPLADLVQDLPKTNRVSENGQAVVLRYKEKDYIRDNKGVWRPYQP